jgi:hypothetical protein
MTRLCVRLNLSQDLDKRRCNPTDIRNNDAWLTKTLSRCRFVYDEIGFPVSLGSEIHSDSIASDRTRDSVFGLFLVGD